MLQFTDGSGPLMHASVVAVPTVLPGSVVVLFAPASASGTTINAATAAATARPATLDRRPNLSPFISASYVSLAAHELAVWTVGLRCPSCSAPTSSSVSPLRAGMAGPAEGLLLSTPPAARSRGSSHRGRKQAATSEWQEAKRDQRLSTTERSRRER